MWLVTGEIIRVTFMLYCPSVSWKAQDRERETRTPRDLAHTVYLYTHIRAMLENAADYELKLGMVMTKIGVQKFQKYSPN